MARPIKETPVLKGSDAKTFLSKQKEAEGKKIEPAVKERIVANYNKLNNLAKF